MVSKSLDDIVMDDEVRDVIRPLFEEATMFDRVSFEHDFQWQAYCDVLYAVIRHFTVMEDIKQYYITSGGLTPIKHSYEIKNTIFAQLNKEIQLLQRYSPRVQAALRASLQGVTKWGIINFLDYVALEDIRKDELVLPEPEKIHQVLSNYFQIISQLDDKCLRILTKADNHPGITYIGGDPDKMVSLGYFGRHHNLIYLEKEKTPPSIWEYVKEAVWLHGFQTPGIINKALALEATVSLQGYTFWELVGEGCGRMVYKAASKQERKFVAIKVEKRGDESSNRRKVEEKYGDMIEREAEVIKEFEHKNIAKHHGKGTLSDGRSYSIEEYLEGSTLEDVIKLHCFAGKEDGLYLLRELGNNSYSGVITQILADVISGLAYLHGKGYIHRDVKPANILIPEGGIDTHFGWYEFDGPVRLGDLELVKKVEKNNEKIEHGSRAYTAPEALQHGILDYRSDIFSLGVVMYEAFTGDHPFAESPTAPYIKLVKNVCDPKYYSGLKRRIRNNDAIPISYKKIILKCLDNDPEKRYTDATEISTELEVLAKKSERNFKLRENITGGVSMLIGLGVLAGCMGSCFGLYSYFVK